MGKDVNKKRELLIFGTQNMALEFKELAMTFYAKEFNDIRTIYFSDNFIDENNLVEKANNNNFILNFIIGFGGSERRRCINALKKFKNFIPFTLIHPAAVIAQSAKIGNGCLVLANSTICTDVVIGDFCVINHNSTVGHHAVLGENIFIQPGSRVGGNCRIGDDSLVGANSFIYQKTQVGRECLIDALTYVRHDVGDRMLVSSRYDKPLSRDLIPKIPMWD